MQSANAYSHGFFLKATHTNPCPPSPAPSNSLRTLFSHSLSDTQVLYKVYDIIRLPTTRQADITSCRDRRGASSQHTSHKYTEAWTFTNTHMHTHMHTQMHQIQGNLDRILHICRVLNSKSTTHTQMLTHLHLHEGSPIEAACCSREGTPQTTPLRHGGHTPLLPSLKPHSFFFFFFFFFYYFTSPFFVSRSLPHPGCPI